jgi:hypothetical protein
MLSLISSYIPFNDLVFLHNLMTIFQLKVTQQLMKCDDDHKWFVSQLFYH